VYPEIRWLKDQGFNIWYDEGLSPGSEWHTALAESIENSNLFLYFVTPRSVESDHCQREVHYAIDHKKQLLAVHLEKTDLPSGLSLSLSSTQAIICHELSRQEYRSKLLKGMSDHIQRGIAQSSESRSPIVSKTTILIAALGLAGLVLGGIVLVLKTPGTDPTPPNSVDPPKTAIRSNWVAVLPFRAVSASNENKEILLAEGITADLIRALSGLGAFSVTSHRAVRTYSASSLSTRQIATELGVRYLIEGRVQTSGTQTRIGVTVVDGVEGKTMCEESQSYQDRELLDIQDDITRFVSRAIDIELITFERERVRNMSTEDMSAWELFALTMNTWEDPTQATFASGIKGQRRALELEPDHVLSLGYLAVRIELNTLMGESPDRAAARQEACQLADRAFALGQDSPFTVYAALEALTEICGEPEKAVQIGRRMVAVHQNSGYIQTILGAALFHAGDLEEAIQVLDDAEQAFPDNYYVIKYTPTFRTYVYTEQQEWDKAMEVSRTSLNLNPSNVFITYLLANALGVLDRPDEAKAVWNQLLVRFPKFTIENYEWWLKQGSLDDERIKLFTMGLKRAGVEEQ
jgi:TolB-like protein